MKRLLCCVSQRASDSSTDLQTTQDSLRKPPRQYPPQDNLDNSRDRVGDLDDVNRSRSSTDDSRGYKQKHSGSSGRYQDEPCTIHYVETSINYENMDVAEDNVNEPIGFKSLQEQNYLSCTIQALFACKKFVKNVLDYNIHMPKKTRQNQFTRDLSSAFQMLEEKSKTDIHKYLVLIQKSISVYPYLKSISNCFLAIFYKIQQLEYQPGNELSFVEPIPDNGSSNEIEKFIVDNFYGRVTVTEICKCCGKDIARVCQFFRLMPLYISKYTRPVGFSEYVSHYFDEIEYEKEDWNCSCESETKTVIRKSTIVRSPDYLIACNEENSSETDNEQKHQASLIVCEKFVHINVNMEMVQYRLIAVIDRMGSSERCSTKCCFEENADDEWWIISDEAVTSISGQHFDQIVTEKSIVFIYRKM